MVFGNNVNNGQGNCMIEASFLLQVFPNYKRISHIITVPIATAFVELKECEYISCA